MLAMRNINFIPDAFDSNCLTFPQCIDSMLPCLTWNHLVTKPSAETSELTCSSGDPATSPPLSLPTTSSLSLQMAFSDGTVRDFSTDSRAVFTVLTVRLAALPLTLPVPCLCRLASLLQ